MLLLASCANDVDNVNWFNLRALKDAEFYATIVDGSNPETKVFADDQMRVLENVTSIGLEALYGCSSLTRIVVKPTIPPTGGTRMFDRTNDCPILIPTGTMERYTGTSVWSGYSARLVEM